MKTYVNLLLLLSVLAFVSLILQETYFTKSLIDSITKFPYDSRVVKKFLFCIILTKQSSLDTKAIMAFESWIHKCDDYRFLTIIPNNEKHLMYEFKYYYNVKNAFQMKDSPKLNLIKYKQRFEYIKLLQPLGFTQDRYKNLTHKVYLAYKYIFKHHPNYEWYIKCDDDTFVYYENLERFLIEKNHTRAIMYGRIVGDSEQKNQLADNQKGFLSGGAGYVMSNEAFTRLAKRLEANYSSCRNRGIEDLDVISCLKSVGSIIGSSFDDKLRCRFHSNNLFSVYPNEHLNGKCCSDTFISFHRVEPHEQLQFYATLKSPGFNGSFMSMVNKMSEFRNMSTSYTIE